jgi:hypothetical protein
LEEELEEIENRLARLSKMTALLKEAVMVYMPAEYEGDEDGLYDVEGFAEFLNDQVEEAKEAVKDIMYIYIFTQMVEEAAGWNTDDLRLTKEEKSNVKDNLEYQAYYYQMYYGYAVDYDLDEAYNGAQYDKVMGYLLSVTEITTADGVKVDSYVNIGYNK